jgi:hypothetical protein
MSSPTAPPKDDLPGFGLSLAMEHLKTEMPFFVIIGSKTGHPDDMTYVEAHVPDNRMLEHFCDQFSAVCQKINSTGSLD